MEDERRGDAERKLGASSRAPHDKPQTSIHKGFAPNLRVEVVSNLWPHSYGRSSITITEKERLASSPVSMPAGAGNV
jgi:hypothetical protein